MTDTRSEAGVETLTARFLAKVDRRGPNECWPWLGAVDHHGYGKLRNRREHGRETWVGAHRVALSVELGRPIASGMLACHRCDTPLCVNPAHLYEGTQADNMADMIQRGRANRNSRRLSADEIATLRRLNAATQDELAVRFGISRRTVTRILSGTRS